MNAKVFEAWKTGHLTGQVETQDKIVRKMIRKGMSARDVADILDIRSEDVRRVMVEDMLEDGMTVQRIADGLGLPIDEVTTIQNHWRFGREIQAEWEKICHLYTD